MLIVRKRVGVLVACAPLNGMSSTRAGGAHPVQQCTGNEYAGTTLSFHMFGLLAPYFHGSFCYFARRYSDDVQSTKKKKETKWKEKLVHNHHNHIYGLLNLIIKVNQDLALVLLQFLDTKVEAEASATMEAMSQYHSQGNLCYSYQDALAYRRRINLQHHNLSCFFHCV